MKNGNVLNKENGTYKLTNFILVVITLFCSMLYDPIVRVDNTPRTPIFKEFLTFSTTTFITNSRFKNPRWKPDSKNLFIMVDRILLLNNVFVLLLGIFLYVSCFSILTLLKSSLQIRAPSTLFYS